MIDLETDDACWTVTINRPEKANSLTAGMLQDLCAIVEDARGKTKVLVITGTGKIFSAGADLEEARAGLATSDLWERLSGGVAGLDCLTIAQLNGTLAGGAFGMVLACDIRIAVPDAKFFYPVMRLGFLPQPSDPKRLSRLVGPARAKMILMAGQKVLAKDALMWGLIDQIVPQTGLEELTQTLASDALSATPEHGAAIKLMCS